MKQIPNIIEQHIDLLVETTYPDGIKISYCPSSNTSMACEVWVEFTFIEGDGEGCTKKYRLSSIQGDDVVIEDRGTEYEPPLEDREDDMLVHRDPQESESTRWSNEQEDIELRRGGEG